MAKFMILPQVSYVLYILKSLYLYADFRKSTSAKIYVYTRRDATVIIDATAWGRDIKYHQTVKAQCRHGITIVAGSFLGDINDPLVVCL